MGDDPVTDTGNDSMNGKGLPMHGKSLAEKEVAQIKLMDRLITSQGALAEAQLDLQTQGETVIKALSDVTDALKPVAQVVTTVEDLSKRLKALEDRLGGAPKRAAIAPETVVDSPKLTDHAEKMLDKTDELFPGSGIKVRKE